MFKHEIESFGSFEKHTFKNSAGDSFSVVPDFGANLIDLRFGNQPIIDGYANYEELRTMAWGKSILLVPYPNRLRDGKYSFEGKNYQFDLNNADTGNSIHGFLSTRPFAVKTTLCTLDEAMLTCTYRHDGSHVAYPFRFTFEVRYILRGSNFEVEMIFTNDDASTVPVGLGWHPYFKIAENAGDVFLQMPDCQIVEADARQLPTGRKLPFSEFKTLSKVNDFKFDSTFLLDQTDGRAEVTLQSESGILTYWQNVDNQNWQFLQVFIPPARKSIALEPMTCNVDAFNNQDGLKCLKTGEILRGVFGVKFSKK